MAWKGEGRIQLWMEGLKILGEGRKNSIRKRLGNVRQSKICFKYKRLCFCLIFKNITIDRWFVAVGFLPAEICARAEVWPQPGHLCVFVPTTPTPRSRVSCPPARPQPSSCIHLIQKDGLFFQPSYWGAKPQIGIFLCVQYMPGAVLCSTSFCSHARGDAPEALCCCRLGCAFPACAFSFVLASQNVSPVFEDF